MEKQKAKIREQKAIDDAAKKQRRQDRERNLMNNILQHNNMKRCTCKSKCNGRSTCKTNDHSCSQFYTCQCDNKLQI